MLQDKTKIYYRADKRGVLIRVIGKKVNTIDETADETHAG